MTTDAFDRMRRNQPSMRATYGTIGGLTTYRNRTTGHRRDGRRIWIFARAGRWWLHIELLDRAFGCYRH